MTDSRGPAFTATGRPPTTFDVAAAWTWSWSRFGQHWRVLVTAMVPYVVAMVALYAIYIDAFLPLWVDSIRGEPVSTQRFDGLLTVWIIVYVAILAVTVLASVLVRNLFAAALLIADGGSPTYRSMFTLRRAYRPIMLAVLSILASFAGLLLCLVPGLVVAVLLCFAVPAMVDEDLGAVASMRRSTQIARQQFWPTALAVLIVGAVASLGSVACLVGVVVSAPVAILMHVHAYRSVTGGQVVA